MNESHCSCIGLELGLRISQVQAVEALLAEAYTVPFIARYRKERTGSLDEVAIAAIRDRLAQLAELDKRREAIIKSLEERDLLTEELQSAIEEAATITLLEDIYLPYRPKKRTRATIAKEKGLEPLAMILFRQDITTDPVAEAAPFVDSENGVESVEAALSGARDILAEGANENVEIRQSLRKLFAKRGSFQCTVAKGKEEEGSKYRDYFDWQEPLAKVPSHRALAMFRGESEGYLRLTIQPPEHDAMTILYNKSVNGNSPASNQVALAMSDAYKRLLAHSLETEMRHEIKARADKIAIRVFAQNIRECLMSPPLGQKSILAIDPAYRTGCKTVCLDRQGNLLHHTIIYPTQSARMVEEAKNVLMDLVDSYAIEAIAIGNGTASRETENFVRSLNLPKHIPIIIVNESGASVYSASDVAREELPAHDITVRGAVSIGRRLSDPLSELVKIDPKAIGVGQYQHDVDQNELKTSLDDVVLSCVNAVGIEVNTASKQLLSYVSGLSPTLARNIVEYREQNGPFSSRKDLTKVPRLGPKAFEQAAGFLRIHDADNLLDASAVHPESYPIVEHMAKDANCTIQDLTRRDDLRQHIDIRRYVSDEIGLPTLNDIMEELAKPGRDPREQFEIFAFSESVNTLEDIKVGMKLPGVVTNVTNFGAFVDIGVHQDGLVHVSQLSDQFVRNPTDIVKVNQKVMVTVLEVDPNRKRIALSLRTISQQTSEGFE